MKLILVVFSFFCLQISHSHPIEVQNDDSIYGRYYQGDIKLTPAQEEALNANSRGGRIGTVHASWLWQKTNGIVVVPYSFESGFGKSFSIKI